MPIIATNRLCKDYRAFIKRPGMKGSLRSLIKREYTVKRAVRDFNLQVEEGEFVGLIGPNGAGKTTLVKLLTGIIAPTSGEISVMGYYPNKLENAFKSRYAMVMGQKSQLFFELTAMDTFALFKELYRIPKATFDRNVEFFVDLLGVEPLLNAQVRTLSLGERMKLELIVALLHDPRVLFLDEPTIGLDAIAQKQIRAFLRDANRERGTTVLLTSHYMEDIQRLCKRCLVINHGESVFDGETDELFRKYQTSKRITVSFSEGAIEEAPPDCEVISREPGKICVSMRKERAEAVARGFMERGVTDISIEEEDIGNVVERIYGDRGGAQ